MDIQLSEIDPLIATVIRKRRAAWKATPLNRNGENADLVQRWYAAHAENRRKRFPELLRQSVFVGLIASLLLSSLCYFLSEPTLAVFLLSFFLSFLVSSSFLSAKQDEKHENSYRLVQRMGMFGFLPTEVEAAYLKLVSELSNTNHEEELSARKLFAQLNLLMTDYHRLARRHEYNATVLSERQDAPEFLNAEYDALIERIQAVSDAATKRTLEQTASLYKQRLESVAALSVEQQRFEAQFDAIEQTFETVRAALVRERGVRGTSDQAASVIKNLSDTVAQIQTQTAAVEQAFEEVATLHAER